MACSHLPPPDVPDPLRVEDRHLSETVLLLARGIAADLAFDRLPILADALEDSGYDNFALLNHLRSDDRHEVGCWAFRRLLRTTLLLPGGVPITFAYCPPGSFLMGSDNAESDVDEAPVHQVKLTNGFYAGIYPVTQKQWQVVMGTDPSDFKGDWLPVTSVSWVEARHFCTAVCRSTGWGVRLPTEAEWEYSCRAGTTTKYHYGDVPKASRMNFSPSLDADRPTPPSDADYSWRMLGVASFPSNPWGLHDCHGNAGEWCADVFEPFYFHRSPDTDPECGAGSRIESNRVIRGGCYQYAASKCRSSSRRFLAENDRCYTVGFRVVFTA